jgi:phosphopantothenoylcysteine decarboxylase/phosphopantothenate--cysteine ligase
MLKGKRILLGITGGIAAYKCPELVRQLKKQGAEVQVICTPNALQFVTSKTLGVVSENPVWVDFFDQETGTWNHHVNLGIWADAMVIAPCGSNTLGKMVHGLCDNLLLATYLSARCPIWVAPAMDLDMYRQEAVQQHIQTLKYRGVHLIDSVEGPLASGLYGKGRMAEPEQIVQYIYEYFDAQPNVWKGKKVLITAGPTQEAIDPVRFLGNRSTGKMGLEMAQVLLNKGAQIHLVLGPTSLEVPRGIEVYRVESALQMLSVCEEIFPTCDIGIFSAAVADYRPEKSSTEKIKKGMQTLEIRLLPNPDIAQTLASSKNERQLCIGFALETEKGIENALHKLSSKNLDAIVLNEVGEHTGFQSDTNKITLLARNDKKFTSDLQTKSEIASLIMQTLDDWGLVK